MWSEWPPWAVRGSPSRPMPTRPKNRASPNDTIRFITNSSQLRGDCKKRLAANGMWVSIFTYVAVLPSQDVLRTIRQSFRESLEPLLQHVCGLAQARGKGTCCCTLARESSNQKVSINTRNSSLPTKRDSRRMVAHRLPKDLPPTGCHQPPCKPSAHARPSARSPR
jgi:hypothetical protein